MKTYKNLHTLICSFSNLLLGSKLAQRGKRFHTDVYQFNCRLEENLLKLKNELETLTWYPGNYRTFYVQESKRRLISAAPYRDRVVHHALCNIIEPLFDKTFIYDSYACRKGKGTHAAADRYTEFCRKAKYVLKCDISQYFPSISHEILYEKIAKKIGDKKTLRLCEKIIRSQNDQGLFWLSGKGIPIGNLTSQFFANVYLNDFDHWVKEEIGCKFYIRYVDDFVILSDNKKWLNSLISRIEEYLSSIKLTLHPLKRCVFPVSEGCDFMGYRIFQTHRRLRPSNGYRFRRKLKRLAEKFSRNEISLSNISARINSWIGHAIHADTYGLRRKIFSSVVFVKG